jgi:hypothetical protein
MDQFDVIVTEEPDAYVVDEFEWSLYVEEVEEKYEIEEMKEEIIVEEIGYMGEVVIAFPFEVEVMSDQAVVVDGDDGDDEAIEGSEKNTTLSEGEDENLWYEQQTHVTQSKGRHLGAVPLKIDVWVTHREEPEITLSDAIKSFDVKIENNLMEIDVNYEDPVAMDYHMLHVNLKQMDVYNMTVAEVELSFVIPEQMEREASSQIQNYNLILSALVLITFSIYLV